MTINTLLIEDNISLAETIVSYCELEGISCDHAATGLQGLDLTLSNNYDTILLDINLPRMNGLAVCEALRNRGVDVPVLMVTAQDSLDDKLAGFDAGTDDYLVKPFEMSELVARIRALARRRSSRAQKLEVGSLVLDLTRKQVSRENQAINLSPTGWKLLELLMRESPNVVSRQQMEHAIWSGKDLPDSNVLKVQLHRLRQKVDKPFAKKLIHTIALHGVAIRAPDE